MRVTPRPRKLPDPDVLERLRGVGQLRAAVEIEIRAAVAAASEAGGSVRVIAEIAQVAPGTVQQWLKDYRAGK